MAKAHQQWTVAPHGPIEKLEENLWRVEAPIVGAPIKRVFVVARLADGRLVLHNGIALGDAEMKELDAFGKPAFQIVPNAAHRLDAKIFKDRYPDATVIAPPGAKEKVEQVVKVDETSGDFHDESVQYHMVEGTAGREGYLQVRAPSGDVTLVFTDIVMNMDSLPGFGGFMMGLMGFTGRAPKVSFPAKMFLVKDKKALRAHLEKLAETPNLARVIVAHGAMIEDAPVSALRAAAASV